MLLAPESVTIASATDHEQRRAPYGAGIGWALLCAVPAWLLAWLVVRLMTGTSF
jgi:hypothetical protein